MENQEPKIVRPENEEILRSNIERLRNALKKWEDSPGFPGRVPEIYKEKIRELIEELESKLEN